MPQKCLGPPSGVIPDPGTVSDRCWEKSKEKLYCENLGENPYANSAGSGVGIECMFWLVWCSHCSDWSELRRHHFVHAPAELRHRGIFKQQIRRQETTEHIRNYCVLFYHNTLGAFLSKLTYYEWRFYIVMNHNSMFRWLLVIPILYVPLIPRYKHNIFPT